VSGRPDPSEQDPSGQWEQDGVKYTVNETSDPAAPGGYYLSQEDTETGDHATAVYNPDDTLADVRANESWAPAPSDHSEDASARREMYEHMMRESRKKQRGNKGGRGGFSQYK
jgi:hypothetical protein